MVICSALGMPSRRMSRSSAPCIRKNDSFGCSSPVHQHQRHAEADGLRGSCGKRGARGAHAKPRHEPQVQHGVHHRSHADDEQRRAGIAHAAQHGGKRVVTEYEHHAHRADAQIRHRLLHGRGAQQGQKRICARVQAHSRRRPKQQRKREQRARRLAQPPMLFCAVILADDDIAACCDADGDLSKDV